MTLSLATAADFTDCEYCGNEPADRECCNCVNERWIGYIREWLTRARTVAPGLTNQECAVVERLIADLEAS
jgi:hypothetical protein